MTEAELGSIPIYTPELETPVRRYRQGPRAVGLIALRVLVLLAAVGIASFCALSDFEGSFSTLSQSPTLFCIMVPVALILVGAGSPKVKGSCRNGTTSPWCTRVAWPIAITASGTGGRGPKSPRSRS